MSKPITTESVDKSVERIKNLGFKSTVYDKHPNVLFERIS